MRFSPRRSRPAGQRSCPIRQARDRLRKSRIHGVAVHAPSRWPSQSTQHGHIPLAMSRSHGTSFRPRVRNELASLQCGQNYVTRLRRGHDHFLRCADGAVETRQPAVAQPAGCRVSIKHGATWGSRGELRCPLERALLSVRVLTDDVHRARCARRTQVCAHGRRHSAALCCRPPLAPQLLQPVAAAASSSVGTSEVWLHVVTLAIVLVTWHFRWPLPTWASVGLWMALCYW